MIIKVKAVGRNVSSANLKKKWTNVMLEKLYSKLMQAT